MSLIPIILLAAGQSSRMRGTDKLMQNVGDTPLLRRSAMTARQVGPVIVALPPLPHPRYQALDGLDLTLVEIPDAAEGMNASLRGAMTHLPAEATAAMVLLSDLPDITAEDLNSVVSSVTEHPKKLIWRGATKDGKPGHPVIFDKSLFAELRRLTGDEGAQTVARAHSDKVHLHPLPNRNALLDLDTPEDWATWRARHSL
ncbi:NTP transferase domain-containing protein [Ruegeria lacuscaerulensis]|uniref:nucleotidyltransferase family protein n=1 Tax=Ruegeria lacuscaerulensis TaxID=55218 RepID=UPI00147E94E7|nr:nucleotidyltransferase family protein [Ruegeria lacuscaerulensis]